MYNRKVYCLEGVIVMKVMIYMNIEIIMIYWKNGFFLYFYVFFWKVESRKVLIIYKFFIFDIVMFKIGDGFVLV